MTGALSLFSPEHWEQLQPTIPDLVAQGLDCRAASPGDCVEMVPVLEARAFAGGLLVPGDGRLDVHELLSSYLRGARDAGAQLRLSAEVEAFVTQGGRCRGVVVADEEIRARVVVNAAGAWAGQIASLAGASPIALRPHRRTIVTFPWPEGVDPTGWPFLASEAHRLYFAAEGGDLLLSPMDEDPMDPCDPTPDEKIIAAGLERLAQLAPALVPRTLHQRWSGLRTFAPDRAPRGGRGPRAARLLLARRAGRVRHREQPI